MRRVAGSLALGAALLAASCGQKGPLYLPDKSVPVITTPAQPAPAQPVPPQSPPAQAPKAEDKDHDPES